MKISASLVKELREKTGAGIMACKKALVECEGDIEKAMEVLKAKGLKLAEKKAGKETIQGKIGAYIHTNGKIGVLVELGCETDFVANNQEFTELLNNLCLQVCATNPRYISKEDIPTDILEDAKREYIEDVKDKPPEVQEKIITGKLDKFFFSQHCLLEQPFIKDEEGKTTVRDLINEKITKFGENIKVKRFIRFELGE